jgi:hypothetical protein
MASFSPERVRLALAPGRSSSVTDLELPLR